MRRIVVTFTVAAVMATTMAFADPALASHEPYLVTPGICVEDVAGGQTEKDPGEGGYHKFHENVHLGTPGMMAFENNPVAVYETGTGPGCPPRPGSRPRRRSLGKA